MSHECLSPVQWCLDFLLPIHNNLPVMKYQINELGVHLEEPVRRMLLSFVELSMMYCYTVRFKVLFTSPSFLSAEDKKSLDDTLRSMGSQISQLDHHLAELTSHLKTEYLIVLLDETEEMLFAARGVMDYLFSSNRYANMSGSSSMSSAAIAAANAVAPAGISSESIANLNAGHTPYSHIPKPKITRKQILENARNVKKARMEEKKKVAGAGAGAGAGDGDGKGKAKAKRQIDLTCYEEEEVPETPPSNGFMDTPPPKKKRQPYPSSGESTRLDEGEEREEDEGDEV